MPSPSSSLSELVIEPTKKLAMLGATCRLGRAIELKLGPELDALALAWEAAEERGKREAAKRKREAALAIFPFEIPHPAVRVALDCAP